MKKETKRDLFIAMFLLVVGTLLVTLLYRETVIVTALLVISWGVSLKFWHRPYDIYFSLMGAVIGTATEIVYVHFGVWQYSVSHFLGIPLWLPLGWGLFTLLIKRLAENLAELRGK